MHFGGLHFYYALPAMVATLVAGAMGLLIWLQRRRTPEKVAFLLFTLGIAIWSLGYALEMLAVSLDAKVFLGRVQYFGIATVPVLWLVFVLRYAGLDRWLTPRRLVALAVVPLATLVLVWTNNLHHLYWTGVRLDTKIGLIPIFIASKGPWFWVYTAYSYVMLAVATGVLVWVATRSPDLLRTQALALLATSVAPWAGHFIYLLRASPLPGLDPTSLGFAIGGLFAVWSLTRLHLLDLSPAARSLALDSVSEAIFVLDEQDRVRDMNQAAERLVGDLIPHAIGLPLDALWPEVDLLRRFAGALDAQEEVAVEGSQGTRYFDVRVSPLRDGRGRLNGRIFVLHDVTAHKRMAQSLRASEERYRTLFEATFEAILLHENGRVLDVNSMFEQMFGFSREEMIGRSVFDFIESDWHPTVEQRIRSRSEEPYEIRVRHKDGTYLDIEIRGKYIDYQGRNVRVAAIRDLTGRRQVEEAERRQRVLAEALRDAAAALNSTLNLDAVLDRILDSVGRVIPHEAANILLLEGGVSRVVRARVRDHALDEQAIQGVRLHVDAIPNLRRMVETGEPVIVPDVQRDPDWQPVPEVVDWKGSYVGAPIRVDSETIGFLNLHSAALGFFTPEHAETLRAFADQAAIAIRNARLYGEVQARNRDLDAFSHTVAHDLRSPLTGVVGSLELLQDSESARMSEDGLEILAYARRAAQKMDQIIDALLLLAGIRSREVAVEPVAMEPIVYAALERLKPEIDERGVEVSVAPDLPPVMGYGPWLEEALANLISNAVKYIGPDNPAPCVSVRAERCSEPARGDRIRYLVVDNGLGIAPEYHDRLFEMFSRFHPGQAKGAGLGLSIVKRIVTRLDGEVGFESAPGKGSAFWFVLPAVSLPSDGGAPSAD